MSALVSLNVLNMLRKSDEMRGLPNIIDLWLNKLNITGAQVLDYFYDMTLKSL